MLTKNKKGDDKMNLILEYREKDSFSIIFDNEKYNVSEDELKQLIRNIKAPERNCKVYKNTVSMKSGYGSLIIKDRIMQKNDKSSVIRVFTNDSYKNYFDTDNIVINTDEYFLKNLSVILKNFNEVDRYYLRKIDKAGTISAGGRLFVKSEYGTTTINNISTGCKTCILDNHFKNKLFNLTLCGGNAIETLFEVINSKGSRNSFLLHHSGFEPLQKYSVKINNQQTGSLFDLWLTIAEEGASRSDEVY